ncbi:polysaccharide pyruvyl transferase family protein [Sphingobium yanoikuyae]|uniref:polysaccharide pyruvyl transferase family protein n=1 Tax=Sphingobium yanoikuyae TaxID=13690 RepID=UPI002FD909E6
MRLKAMMAGDHSTYHCGSAAVFSTLRHLLEVDHDIVEAGDFDVLYVNGEGSMHHDSGQFTKKMELLKAAIENGKRAYLVNSVWQENGHQYDDVLARLSGITVRELASQEELAARHGITATMALDLSYYAPIDEDAAHQDWRGQVMITDFYARDFGFWYRVNSGPLTTRSYVDMRDYGWSAFVRSLRTCRAIITGRHHAVYAACVARKPFVTIAGSTHKVSGLIAASGFPIPTLSSPRDANETLRWTMANRAMFQEFFHWMDEVPRWRP